MQHYIMIKQNKRLNFDVEDVGELWASIWSSSSPSKYPATGGFACVLYTE